MPALEAPRFTYAPTEGLRINYAPAYDELKMAQDLDRSGLFLRKVSGMAMTQQLEPANADRLLNDIHALLDSRSFPDIKPPTPSPVEAGRGGYGFWYDVRPDFKDRLHSLFSSGEDNAIQAAVLCFAAMDRLNPHYRSKPDELYTDHDGEGSYLFTDGPYRLRVQNGSIDDLYFGGDAGLNTADSRHTSEGDTIHHYNNDHAYQKIGLFLGVASIAHSVYRHSLLGDMATVLKYKLQD
ncbi:MAG: hypothetical protein AAB462_04260 [Patescibacteria group bacterium]